MMAHNMSGGRMQHVLHANAMQQQRPMNNINPFVAVPTQTYHHQAQVNVISVAITLALDISL